MTLWSCKHNGFQPGQIEKGSELVAGAIIILTAVNSFQSVIAKLGGRYQQLCLCWCEFVVFSLKRSVQAQPLCKALHLVAPVQGQAGAPSTEKLSTCVVVEWRHSMSLPA